jgi:hypothetical protein
MLGLSTRASSNTNQLHIHIPDELKGVELQVIILPAGKANDEINFFTDAELALLPKMHLGTPLDDEEDYSKW